jgi:hypothetical protein
MRKLIFALVIVASVLGSAAAVVAFPTVQYWHMPASGRAGQNRAGAEGIYGTGGRTDFGVKCSHCHIEPEGLIDLAVDAVPAFGDVGGERAYAPGQRYTLTVRLIGEHLIAGAENRNGMALTIEDASGRRAGRFISDAGQDSSNCPQSDPYPAGGTKQPATKTTVLYGDCHAVLPLGHARMTSWTFDWVAPSAGAGGLTMFVAVVDGDTGGESSLADDVVERALPLHEGSP